LPVGSASAARASIACSANITAPSRRTEGEMPIKPEMRGFYSRDWPEVSRTEGRPWSTMPVSRCH
jgi:hypothetical protein